MNDTAQHAQSPSGAAQPVASIPFVLASRKMTRLSFDLGTVAAATGASTNINPVQIPAVGYLSGIMCEVTVALTSGAAAGVYTADAPFNAIQSAELRTSAGNDILVPYTGYQVFLMNKYGTQFAEAPASDPRQGRQYAAPAPVANTTVNAHYFLYIPFEVDLGTGYGAIPAMASNRSYQLNFILSSLATVAGANITGGSVAIKGIAFYWSEPPNATQSGAPQATEPSGVGTVSQWQIEMPPVTPGDKLIKSNNVGAVLRTQIFVLRTAGGARTDADWPAVFEYYLDNEPMFYFTNTLFEEMMIRKFQFFAAAKDVAGGLDTGVYVVPFHALAGSTAGAVANSRSQYLPTGDGSQVQARMTSIGAAGSTLEILTNSVIPTDAATLFSR